MRLSDGLVVEVSRVNISGAERRVLNVFASVSWSGFPIIVDTFAFFCVIGTPDARDPGAQGGREAPASGSSVAEVTVLLSGKQSSRWSRAERVSRAARRWEGPDATTGSCVCSSRGSVVSPRPTCSVLVFLRDQ